MALGSSPPRHRERLRARLHYHPAQWLLAEEALEVARKPGLASIALVGAGVGIGTIFGNYLQGALRNPSAAPTQFANLLLGFALAEATGLFGLVVALIILFVF